MVTLSKPLLELTAADLMSQDVLTLPWDMSLRAAAHLLAERGVSGAPVVDKTERCIGILSQSDLVRSLDKGEVRACAGGGSADFFADWQVMDLEGLADDAVARHMSGDAITAPPGTPIQELARLMSAFRIHRVLITAADGRLLGLVSALDLAEALAASGAEAE